MSFLDKLFLSGVAAALKTPTGQIDVSSTAPIANYVLKVNAEATRAEWQPETGGGGGGGTAVWLADPHVVLTPTLEAEANGVYLCLGGATDVTLPDATLPENNGRMIILGFFAAGNTINGPSLESPNLIVECGGSFGTGVTDIPASTVALECVYDPDVYPQGFWMMMRYALGSPSKLPSLRVSEVIAVYPKSDLPAPYNVISETDGDVIEGQVDSLPANIAHDFQGSYGVGQLVLFPFINDRPGVYRCVRDNGGTDWAFKFIEGPDSDPDPSGSQSYYVKIGEGWGARTFEACPGLNPPFYRARRQALDIYPQNGDVLATGSNSGNVHDNTNQLVAGRVNLLKTNGSFANYTLDAPADPSLILGERFAVQTVIFTGTVSFTINVDVNNTTIQGPDGLTGNSVTFDLQLGTYAEWMLVPDNDGNAVWRLVSFIPGSGGG